MKINCLNMITFIFRLHSVTFLRLLKVRCKNKVKKGNLGITIISRQFLCSTDLQYCKKFINVHHIMRFTEQVRWFWSLRMRSIDPRFFRGGLREPKPKVVLVRRINCADVKNVSSYILKHLLQRKFY